MSTAKSWIVPASALIFLLVVFMYCMHTQSVVSVLIVPHHNLVSTERSALFADVAPRIQDRKIILLSTNHYDVGTGVIQTRTTNFTTAENAITVDNELASIAMNNGVTNEPVTFETEHGIKTILPDIATYAPGALVLPLIIKEDAPKQTITKLINELFKNCPDCLVVASVDFSHYQPYLLSELHDDVTRRGMQNVDMNLIETKAEIGEPQVLSAAIQWAKLAGTYKFVEQNHTNATEIENNYYAEGTTHFFGWYESGVQAVPESEVTFTFVGDVMFDRNIRERFHPNYYDGFSKLGNRVLWGTDGVIGNLEGPITQEETLPADTDIPRFSFSPLVTTTLKKLHFTDVSLKNNHTLDAGNRGYDDTITALKTAGIQPLYTNTPQIIEGYNHRIVLFTVDFANNETLSQADIAAYKNKNSSVVVYVHWGPEYQDAQSNSQVEFAQYLIDSGADMVVGTGPHVIQPAEIYKNRPIIYSLGNFYFDMTDNKQTSTGLVLTGKFSEDNITIQPMLTENIQLQPVLLRSKNTDEKLLQYFKDVEPYRTSDKGGIQFTISKEYTLDNR